MLKFITPTPPPLPPPTAPPDTILVLVVVARVQLAAHSAHAPDSLPVRRRINSVPEHYRAPPFSTLAAALSTQLRFESDIVPPTQRFNQPNL